jgi:putative membrane protein
MTEVSMRHRLRTGLSAAVILSTGLYSAAAADKLSDAQIAHVAYTAGDLDVKLPSWR